MKKLWKTLLTVAAFLPLTMIAQETPQVIIESRMVEASDAFSREIGFQFGLGPAMSFFTNTEKESRQPATGIHAQAGVDVRFNPYFSLTNSIVFTQYGQKYSVDDYSNKQLINFVGAQSVANVILPGKVEPSLGIGVRFGANTGGSNTIKFGGEKDKVKFDLTDNDNRFYAGLVVSLMVTPRTNAGDLSIGLNIVPGLTELQKDAPERRVPLLFEIPVIYRFFGRKEKTRERENLLILITPTTVSEE